MILTVTRYNPALRHVPWLSLALCLSPATIRTVHVSDAHSDGYLHSGFGRCCASIPGYSCKIPEVLHGLTATRSTSVCAYLQVLLVAGPDANRGCFSDARADGYLFQALVDAAAQTHPGPCKVPEVS